MAANTPTKPAGVKRTHGVCGGTPGSTASTVTPAKKVKRRRIRGRMLDFGDSSAKSPAIAPQLVTPTRSPKLSPSSSRPMTPSQSRAMVPSSAQLMTPSVVASFSPQLIHSPVMAPSMVTSSDAQLIRMLS